ncbi:MAG: head GIN domain-containing protein [Steroidobacteraceae bacterium]|jgi:hypothetical protein|nr:head GIN domain-containing protein [Steroidobacteraceae bacterium]
MNTHIHIRGARALLPVIFALTILGCTDRDMNGRARESVRSETRPLAGFDSIEMKGAARLEITVGSEESVVIEARKNALQHIRTEVSGETLHIDGASGGWFGVRRPRVTIRVTLPALESLMVEGGNDVRLTGFDGGSLTIRSEGAAHIKGDGRLEKLEVHMAGAGHVDLSRLIADQATVTVDGVGSVYVHPRNSLDARMNGVGAILYSGDPRQVSTQMNGLGTIGRREVDDQDAADGEPGSPPQDEDQRRPAADSTIVIRGGDDSAYTELRRI